MCTSMSNAGRPAYYTVRQVAWILGVDQSKVTHAIQVGTLRAIRRRGRLVVPASELARLLSTDDESSGGAP